MSIALNQILALVGRLNDSPGEEVPRERFRRFLQENVVEVGQIRDHVEECLRLSGDQYNRALQDLVNHLGHFLGFEVVFGRYQGARGQLGSMGTGLLRQGSTSLLRSRQPRFTLSRLPLLLGM